MASFYAEHVHKHIHANPSQTLEKYRRRIQSELVHFDVNPADLKNKTVLDIGSGWQSIVFQELGCRKIFHLDINPLHVNFLNNYSAEHAIKNIISETTDVCRSLGSSQEIDLAFVAGVYHHLSDREAFLGQLLPKMAANSEIMFRVYRSGTWSRWLVASLRNASTGRLTPELLFTAYRMLRPHDWDNQFIGDMIDDLLTPQWQAFCPNQFLADARTLQLKCKCVEPPFKLDFSERDENFRIKWRVGQTIDSPPLQALATGRDHDTQIDIPEEITILQQQLLSFLASLTQYSDRDTSTVLVSLYFMVRRHNGANAFLGTIPKDMPPADLANWRIHALQQALRNLQEWLTS